MSSRSLLSRNRCASLTRVLTPSCQCPKGSDKGAHAQVEWLRSKIQHIPIRLAFESALELMGTTQLNTFQVGSYTRSLTGCDDTARRWPVSTQSCVADGRLGRLPVF